ncbi:hypothetical protein R3P38DRAFT_3114297, partial [Favolaschia claudopus]
CNDGFKIVAVSPWFLLSVSVLKSWADLNILLGQLFFKDASPLPAHKNVSGFGNDTALGVEVKRMSGWEECSVCHLLAYWTFADAGKWVMSGIQDARCSANTESVSVSSYLFFLASRVLFKGTYIPWVQPTLQPPLQPCQFCSLLWFGLHH